MFWLDYLSDLAARPLSAVIAKAGILVELAVAVAVSARLVVTGAQIPDGILAVIVATGFALLGWFGTLALRLDRSTSALEVRLSDLAEDGLASASDLRELGRKVNTIETEVAVLKAEIGLGDRRSPE